MRKITVTTAQKVAIDFEVASLRDRIIAFFIDFLILFGAVFILWMGATVLLVSSREENKALIYFLIFVILPIVIFYHLCFEVLRDGQSPGKLVMGMRVLKVDGQIPEIGDYFVRWVFRFIDLFSSGGSIAVVLISSSNRGQRLGDVLSNTVVIKYKGTSRFSLNDILKIQSLNDYVPNYKQVKELSEEDVLIIKQALDRVKRYPNSQSKKALSETVKKVKKVLKIEEEIKKDDEFLTTVLKDYIVLTR